MRVKVTSTKASFTEATYSSTVYSLLTLALTQLPPVNCFECTIGVAAGFQSYGPGTGGSQQLCRAQSHFYIATLPGPQTISCQRRQRDSEWINCMQGKAESLPPSLALTKWISSMQRMAALPYGAARVKPDCTSLCERGSGTTRTHSMNPHGHYGLILQFSTATAAVWTFV